MILVKKYGTQMSKRGFYKIFYKKRRIFLIKNLNILHLPLWKIFSLGRKVLNFVKIFNKLKAKRGNEKSLAEMKIIKSGLINK